MESTLRCHRLEKHQKFYNESEIDENTEESDDEDAHEPLAQQEVQLAEEFKDATDEELAIQCDAFTVINVEPELV